MKTHARTILFALSLIAFTSGLTHGQPMDAKRSKHTYSTTYNTMKVDGLNIFYREAGAKDAPTIVLLHGYPTSSHMYRNLINDLSADYHLIAPDYPGFGRSSQPSMDKFDYTFDNFADIIDKLLVQLQVDTYSLYLMDYGAPVGFRIASRHPERVEALIIQNGNAYDEGLRDFWIPIKKYWNDYTVGKRQAFGRISFSGGIKVAIYARGSGYFVNQPG